MDLDMLARHLDAPPDWKEQIDEAIQNPVVGSFREGLINSGDVSEVHNIIY